MTEDNIQKGRGTSSNDTGNDGEPAEPADDPDDNEAMEPCSTKYIQPASFLTCLWVDENK